MEYIKILKAILFNRHFYAFIILMITGFIAIALFSYSPEDYSLFFYSTNATPIHNKMGFIGSYIASSLLYIFGGVAYLWIVFGVYCVYALISHFLFKQEWERFFSFGILFCGLTILHYFYGVNIFPHFNAGGKFGEVLVSFLSAYIDTTLIFVGSIVGIWISLILISRMAFVSVVHYIMYATNTTMLFFYHLIRPVIQPLIYKVASIGNVLGSYVRKLFFDHKERLFGKRSQNSVMYQEYNSSFSNQSVHQNNEDISGNVFYETSNVNSMRGYTYTSLSEDFEEDKDDLQQPNTISENKSLNDPYLDESQNQVQSIKVSSSYQNESELIKPYNLPPSSFFIPPMTMHDARSQEEVQIRARILEEKLECFGVAGSVVSIKHGPVVTLFEYEPAINTKISKIMALEDDLALALQALSIRIIAPVPGTPYVGFEVANKDRKSVSFASLARSSTFNSFSGQLPLILGENTIGSTVIVDLASMPHLLIAGSTGSGKSVALNTMLMSLLCKCSPEQLRMILIDPKRLEFAVYADLPHLLFPIITESKKSIGALRWVVKTMEDRYEEMAQSGARNIFDYNRFRKEQGKKELPFIIVIIDELADLMMTTGKEIEDLIVRIAQMARASGIHMILATQRPSVDVITGLIKVNFPSRISCRVTSKVDSRTILDSSGAEKLLGKGDMLFLNSNAANLQRVHGAYISDEEIQKVTDYIRTQRKPLYIELDPTISSNNEMMNDADDELFQDIVSFLETVDEVSISLLQRRFRIGYNRSARIIDTLEAQGYITMSEGSKMRKVIR
jgi:DNA segregation ATPase FtsK/SpoIIIE, S-DNA-T family